MKITWQMALLAGLTAPAALASAQTTGVSHPDDIPITTSDEGIQQPVVYKPAASLKPRVAIAAPKADEAPVLSATAAVPVSPAVAPAAMASDADVAPAMHPDVDNDVITRVAGPSNELPIGTMLKVRLNQDLTTRSTANGTRFTAELVESVLRDGRVLLPVGTVLEGHVNDVHGGRRISGTASLHLEPTQLTLPDGTEYVLHAQVIDSSLHRNLKVDEEGTITRSDHAGKTLAGVGLSTGAGAAAGAVFGGWPGAVIGAGIGAGVSTVVWLKQDRQAVLPVETKVIFQLTKALPVGAK